MAESERGEDGPGQAPWSALLDRKYSTVVPIGCSLFFFQHLSRINAVFYFSSIVFRNVGVTSKVGATIYLGIVNLAASCLATILVDKQGRRNLLMWSFFGMALGMALQAAAASVKFLAPIQGNLSLLATLSYVFMFALGAGTGPVPALLLPGIFASRIRAKAMFVAMCVHWIVNFMVGLFFLQLLMQLGPSTLYTFFSGMCLMGAIFVMRNVLETKGRSLEDLETYLLADL